MDDLRVNAALAELNALNQTLTQRCINLAGELAVAQDKIKKLEVPRNNPDGTIEAVPTPFDRNTGNDDN